MTRGRVSYRVDILPPDRSHPSEPQPPREWIKQTRRSKKADAEMEAALWKARGFEVQIVREG